MTPRWRWSVRIICWRTRPNWIFSFRQTFKQSNIYYKVFWVKVQKCLLIIFFSRVVIATNCWFSDKRLQLVWLTENGKRFLGKRKNKKEEKFVKGKVCHENKQQNNNNKNGSRGTRAAPTICLIDLICHGKKKMKDENGDRNCLIKYFTVQK